MLRSVKSSSSHPSVYCTTQHCKAEQQSRSDLGKAVMYRGEGGEDSGERRERGDSEDIVKPRGATLHSPLQPGEQVKHWLALTDTLQSCPVFTQSDFPRVLYNLTLDSPSWPPWWDVFNLVIISNPEIGGRRGGGGRGGSETEEVGEDMVGSTTGRCWALSYLGSRCEEG